MSYVSKLPSIIKFNIAIVIAIVAYYLSLRYSNSRVYISEMMNYKDALRPSTLALASLILFSSSFGTFRAKSSSLTGSIGHTKTMLILSQLLGLVFLGLLGKEIGYISSLETPLIAASGFFSNLYYLLIYMFTAQLILAIVLMFLTYFQLEFSDQREANLKLLNLSTSFWNTVVLLWVVVFFLLYLI